jgi:signal transduction histidine kinase/PAS domain-containing protein
MFSPVTLLVGTVLALGGILGLGVAYVAFRHRDHPAAEPLAKMAGFTGLSAFCFATLTLAATLPIARSVLAAGIALLVFPIGYFLLFVFAYTGRSEWATRRRRRIIVGFFGVLGSLSVFDALVVHTMTVETVNGLTYPVLYGGGPLYLALLVIVYAAVLVGFVLLGQFLISPRNMYRTQTALIIVAIGTTVTGSVVFEAGFGPHPGLNLTAVFYTVETMLIALALFRYEFLNVEPLAPEIVLEEMDDPVLVLDETDTLIDANPAARALFDSPHPVGAPVNDLLPGLLGAAARDAEYVLPGAESRSGRLDVYDLNAAPVTDQYDRDRGTVIVFRDITLQKQREQTLERLQSVSQRFLTAETVDDVLDIAVSTADDVLDCPYSGAMVYDDDAGVLRPAVWTEALTAAFDGEWSDDQRVVSPGESDVWQVFESGEPVLGEPLKTDPGTEFPFAIGSSLLYPLGEHGVLGISAGPDRDGFSDDDRRFASTLASTTENALDRVDKEQQLRESRELLATRNEQIEFFNGVLRHDLLNGMQVIQANLDALSATLDEQAAERADVIDSWVEDIVTLTRNVRGVSRAIARAERTDLEPVETGVALRRTIEKIRNGHDSVTVDVGVDLDRLPAVVADEFLPSVFENLLLNAIEHNDRAHTEITVDGSVDEDRLQIRISDNGPGIDDDLKERLFEQSVTSEQSGSIGFGLYFVRMMIDQYNGDAWFEDRVEAGPEDAADASDDQQRGTVAVLELPAVGTTAQQVESND